MPEGTVRLVNLRCARCAALAATLFCTVVAAGAQRHKSETYSVAPPAGWTQASGHMPADAVAFVGPGQGAFAVNINVMSEGAPHETLDQYVAALRRQVGAHKEMKILRDGAAKLAARPAHATVALLTVNRPGVPPLLVRQVVAMHRDRAYILTLVYPKPTPDAAAKKYIAVFERLAASFQWVR